NFRSHQPAATSRSMLERKGLQFSYASASRSRAGRMYKQLGKLRGNEMDRQGPGPSRPPRGFPSRACSFLLRLMSSSSGEALLEQKKIYGQVIFAFLCKSPSFPSDSRLTKCDEPPPATFAQRSNQVRHTRVWCLSHDGKQRWKLEFNVRERQRQDARIPRHH